MRWEPAENGGLDRTWTPRDDDAWPFTFAAKHHGNIPTSSSDVNYRRYKLAYSNTVTYPDKVLDSVEPRDRLFLKRTVNWPDNDNPSVTGGADTSDVRRMMLVVNLRRTDASDTVVDDSVVASIVVPYQLRWKDHSATRVDSSRYRMPFTRIPYATADSIQFMPLGRGKEIKRRTPPGGYSDSILITRRMLPLHTALGGPDITIVAEFRTDTIRNNLGTRVNRVLKTAMFDYPAANITDSILLIHNVEGFNKRYMAIDTLGVTIHYHGTTTPIAIRAASLLTPQTYRATCGHNDVTWGVGFKAEVDSIKKVQQLVYGDTTRALSARRTIKVLGFYTCDEFDIQHLVGMRYRLELLDRRLTSETGFAGARTYGGYFRTEFGKHKLHAFPSKFLWTAGVTTAGRPTVSPYCNHSGYIDEWGFNTNTPIPAPILSLKAAFGWPADGAPHRRWETDVSTNASGAGAYIGLPIPTTPFNYQSISAYEHYIHTEGSLGGPPLDQENAAYTSMYQTGDWYFAKRRYFWSNFFYHLDHVFALNANGVPYVRYDKFRPLTGEEVRLQHGTSLNLGTRGFMYDKWKNDPHVPPSAAELTPAERVTLKGKQIYPSVDSLIVALSGGDSAAYYFPGYVGEDSTARAWDDVHRSIVRPDSLLRSTHLGGDYYTTNDLIDIHSWAPLGTIASSMRIQRFMPGDSSQHVYVGRVSVRMESKWWHDLVTDTVTRFKRGVDSSNAHFFMKTRPVGWFGKGYKNLTNGDTIRLRKWVEAFADSMKVYRWKRKSATDTTLVLEKEPVGEQLYDVVLMDTSEAGVSDDNCIIAITNRRTSPHLFNSNLADSVEFMSSYDFDQLTRDSLPNLRYKQVGARRITLPFRYTVDSTKPYLLRVRELRPAYDSAYTIDTIVSWQSDLTMFFRPGETRYLKINRYQATDTLNAGFLAFSTQNKMVAYPVANATNTAYTDSIRYHLAFHRRDTTDYKGVWSVFYQRSIPYHRDSLPLVAGLHWETPIRVSGMTTSSVAFTDGQNRTRYFNVDSVEYLGWLNFPEDSAKNLCCGFPSIVVREVTPFNPKVFVTYACEDEWADNDHKDKYFHIVENAFADVAVPNRATLDGNGKSLIICSKAGLHDRGGDTLKSLARYGTPVINAASAHNMYYAWSSRSNTWVLDPAEADLLGAATKADTLDWMTANDAIITIPNVTITSDALTMDYGSPRYPSLNVYSNIAQNRSDATLVWQEGTTNPHIRYTRLIQGLTPTAIDRALPVFTAMTYVSGGPGPVPVDPVNNIAVVGGAEVDDDAGLPVVVRSLQQETMWMFERDSNQVGLLLPYNYETVAWEEYVRSNLRSRIRYNHFIDLIDSIPATLRYWYANTTYGDFNSLFHPVLTNGDVKLDSMVWEGYINESTFVTYMDSLKIVWGNLSGAALIANYNILPQGVYSAMKVQRDAGNAVYWTGHNQFSALKTQQITMFRGVGAPQPPSITVHPDTLRTGGAWPHVSMRQRENSPTGILSVRRVLQYTSGVEPAPSLVASAEQFYKLSKQDEQQVPPALSGGFDIGLERVTARAALSDGRSVSFRPVYDVSMPSGYPGDVDYAWLNASMTTPVRELVTDVFAVGDVSEMKLLTTGLRRNGVEVSIEEVDPATLTESEDGSVKPKNFRAPKASFALAMAVADEEKPNATSKAMYYLTAGDNKYYRLRMTYSGEDGRVFREDLNIAPEAESFGKAGTAVVRVVDLRRMTGTTIGRSADLRIFPNPSSDRVTIIIDGLGLLPDEILPGSLVLDIVDGLGRTMLTNSVSLGEAVDVSGLPNGVYVARVRLESQTGMSVRASGQFSIVK